MRLRSWELVGGLGREWTGSQRLGGQGGTNTCRYQVLGAKIWSLHFLSLPAPNPFSSAVRYPRLRALSVLLHTLGAWLSAAPLPLPLFLPSVTFSVHSTD